MKIAHVVEPFSSGITTFIIHLVNGMPEHQNVVIHGMRVGVDDLTKVRSKFDQTTEFVVWSSVGRSISFLKDIKAAFELFRILKKVKADVIHLHSSKAGFLGRLAGIFIKGKIIYTPNGLSFERRDVSTLTKYFYIILEWIASKMSGTIICCSRSEGQVMRKYGIECEYINNGTLITGIKELDNRNLNDSITIGCLALITEQKDPHTFNEIATHFLFNEKIKFKWIGDGHLRGHLTSSNIEVTGWLDAKEKENKFSELDIYLSCSLWEGLPFSVLEAMNLKQCLLLRNCVGNVDLVDDEVNGYLFQSTDDAIKKLERIISNSAMIRQMGESSFKMLKEGFDVSEMVLKYSKKYLSYHENN